MGAIRIDVGGSFGAREPKIFTALKHGHAHAVGQAIGYLTDLLREAVNLDHNLHAEGEEPDKGFLRARFEE